MGVPTNKGLNQLAIKADIEANLTSYVARHTFASTANNFDPHSLKPL